jgi:hypothetical protein
VSLGQGALRENLEVPSSPDGWWFTHAGNAYIAIRVPNADVTMKDPDGSFVDPSQATGDEVEIRIDAARDVNGGGVDIWTPLVVQVSRAASHSGFADFKADVLAQPYAWNGTRVTYTPLSGPTLAMDRQQVAASLPLVGGASTNVNPSKAYHTTPSSQRWITTPNWSSNWLANATATLKGPGGSQVVLDLTYAFSP